MKAKNIQEAWNMAKDIFPTDYQKDEESSLKAGYPIYRSTADGRYHDYICDLNDRLEVNLEDGNRTINIWIETEEAGEDVEVTVIAKSGEARTYQTYAEYRKEFRFFLSSGKRYEDNEKHFEKIINALRGIGEDGVKIETHRSGVTTVFTYKKWRGHADC